MLRLIIRLSALSIGLSYATISCQKMQQSQLASINERINQMLDSLYTPPFLSKTKSTSATTAPASTEAPTTPTCESASYPYRTPYPASASTPQVIYMPPPPAPSMPWNMEAALQPTDYSYPASNLFPRAVCPTPYFYGNYPPPPYSPVAYPPYPYPYPMKPNDYNYHPEYAVSAYPPVPGYPSMTAPPPYLPPIGSPPPPYHPPLPSPPPPYSASSPYPPLSPSIPSYPTMPYPKPLEMPQQYQPV
ncbi:leucine-rich repeat extensin-like protein 1 [Manduca sexta]|uniref:Uncharacterized protein n=1 Tax=Manduca sexta TaxID=7130 RepID=A0A921ZPA3_MANSE|nr:leucine-rich repeat extensin-like protein 1 [Manduca sexta]KAG6461431.1 hypothetical protein O3G_MSEX012620 [Manduca sexta]